MGPRVSLGAISQMVLFHHLVSKHPRSDVYQTADGSDIRVCAGLSYFYTEDSGEPASGV